MDRINDRHEFLNLYASQCPKCVHFNWDSCTCNAFPDEIPDNILSGEENHDSVLPGQRGETVFEEAV